MLATAVLQRARRRWTCYRPTC